MLAEYFNTESAFAGNSKDGVHDVIIHGLNQSLKYNGEEVFLPVEPFQQSTKAWDGIPAIYVPNGKHPLPQELNANLEATLKKYNGQIVGKFDNTQVITEGQARLQSQARITNPEVEQNIQEGKISLSSTFYGGGKGTNTMELPIIPSYVLLFDKDKDRPRDKLSVFLNTDDSQEEPNMAEEAVKIATLERDVQERDGIIERMNTESTDKDSKIAELDGTILRMNTEAEEKDAKIAKLEEQVTMYANTEADMKWEALKATRIPKGLVATPDAEQELRELHNTDKDAFYGKLMDVARPPESKEEGNLYNNTEGDDKAPSIGNYNPHTGNWE